MRRFGSLLVALAGVALVLAGCGGQQFPQAVTTPTTLRATAPPEATRDPRAWLLASVKRTSTLKSARLALTMKLTGFGEETMSLSGIGLIDFAGRKASLSLRGQDNGEPVSVETRVVGGTIYTRTDDQWLSNPVSASDVNTPNPASYLSYLEAVSSNVRVDGHQVLRGVDTTRYLADVDFDRALAHAAGPAQRKVFAQALTLFGGVKMPLTAWVDADGYVRREQISLDLSTALRAAGVAVTGHPMIVVVLELYDFGVPVDVVAPTGAIDAATAAQFRAAQSDLRNALTAEKTYYTDQELYSADPTVMREIEPSLGWGGKLKVVVGAADGVGGAVVCISEASAAGPVFSIADVASGSNAGTYYARGACPPAIDDTTAAVMGASW